ncbi:MAG: PIN domain-containing protein [Actinomycetota bacterium]|nr:PIN domain-containing protein [Actinomycetota bacterium]
MQVILDTSAIIALVDKSSSSHLPVKEYIMTHECSYVIPSPAVPEICYMLNSRFGSYVELQFIQQVADSVFYLEPVSYMDILRIGEILNHYSQMDIGYVDAAIIAIAERLNVNKLITLDKKHFSVVVPKNFEGFDLLV